jgi:3-keto-disaccharide hydrolase
VTSSRIGRMLAVAVLAAAAACMHPGHRVSAPNAGGAANAAADRREWIQLFNGRNLDGWVPKIKGYPLGENFGDTFRVGDGLLKVAYDKYTTFDERYGHLFYRQRFSHYIIAAEYRFVGEQVPGGPEWAFRNNGLMLHSQAPETMGKDQDFPISIEAQLLGGGPTGERPTLNVCTPGTEIFQNGAMVKGHCKNSTSATYRGDQWVRVEVEVLGADHIRHMIDGHTVLEYDSPQIGGGNVANFNPEVKIDGKPLSEGYIAIQGESHPTEFRKIELLNLSGCMQPKASNFKSYYVHHDDETCR